MVCFIGMSDKPESNDVEREYVGGFHVPKWVLDMLCPLARAAGSNQGKTSAIRWAAIEFAKQVRDIDLRNAEDCAKARQELGSLADAYAKYPVMMGNLEAHGLSDEQLLQAARDAETTRA